MFSVKVHLNHFSSGILVHLFVVSVFIGDMALRHASIYMIYLHNKVLYQDSVQPQCSSPDGVTSALPVGLFPLL